MIWTIDFRDFLFWSHLFIKRPILANIRLEVLHSTFLKWSRYRNQNAIILRKWLHNFCRNLLWTIYFKEFLSEGCLFMERPIYRISNWKHLSPHLSNGNVNEIKRLVFWFSDFITFIQISFELLILGIFYLWAFYLSKGQF